MSDLSAGQLKAFRSDFAGRVVTADDADYDAVRAECVWNGDIDRRPWAIARACTADDVAAAVRLARESGRDWLSAAAAITSRVRVSPMTQ